MTENWGIFIHHQSEIILSDQYPAGQKLYDVARDFAGLTGTETVYDLYCGTGSIGIYVSGGAARVIGVEVVEDAIEDARKNAALNNIDHARFFAGDVIKVCTDTFLPSMENPMW